MDIVGGFYKETSLMPEIDQIFGSGGRAAAILSQITDDVTLHTYIDNNSDIAQFEKKYSIEVKKYHRDSLITFSYFHLYLLPIYQKVKFFSRQSRLTVKLSFVSVLLKEMR